jgi:hypothetical protein
LGSKAFCFNAKNPAQVRVVLTICVLLISCASHDPVLPGERMPVFAQSAITTENSVPLDIGRPLTSADCTNISVNSKNEIWRGSVRLFAGLPTESEMRMPRKAVCRKNFVYAGLSTGELVKVNVASGDIKWTADIFAERSPTGGSPFLNIAAAPILRKGFVYAGGLGGAFCKIRDQDGKKIWCLPMAVRSVLRSTEMFDIVLTTEDRTYAVSTDGKVYEWQE